MRDSEVNLNQIAPLSSYIQFLKKSFNLKKKNSLLLIYKNSVFLKKTHVSYYIDTYVLI